MKLIWSEITIKDLVYVGLNLNQRIIIQTMSPEKCILSISDTIVIIIKPEIRHITMDPIIITRIIEITIQNIIIIKITEEINNKVNQDIIRDKTTKVTDLITTIIKAKDLCKITKASGLSSMLKTN